MQRAPFALAGVCLAALPVLAQQPPAAGYAPTAEERQAFDQKRSALVERLKTLKPQDRPDAAVFLHIADLSQRMDVHEKGPGVGQIDNKGQFQAVLRGLDTGLQRCELLAKGERPWTTKPGKSLRGFVSAIDGSIQPYAVVLPSGSDAASRTPQRLDIDLHGRGTTEVRFLQANEPAPGSAGAKPVDQPFITLLPFGRGNNGWRWAGETDVFEALEEVRRQYPVDPNRTILRGFSMGGHGAWHIGVHHPGKWAAVSPGAGFSDTRKYAKLASGDVPAYQEKAWRIYDAVDYALNLFNAPFIGYGGDKDPQLQAALNMKERAAEEKVPLTVIVGPNTEHKYHPDSLAEIMRLLSTAKSDPRAPQIKFTTYTLKYNQCKWVTVDSLREHYQRADIQADASGKGVVITTSNITGFTLSPVPTGPPFKIDGQEVAVATRDLPARLTFRRIGSRWQTAPATNQRGELRKRHGLQGPIDDAFTGRFVVVKGTGKPWSASTQSYAESAIERFQDSWRLGFRGELPLREDR
ncbi:MAG: alpha/beta hydrolase-fold protein, partial [Actinomycetota bacterium]